MSLYSNSLCGLILLVPKRIRLTTSDIKEGISKVLENELFLFCFYIEFASVCERSTDFHFPSFEQQLSNIEECLQQANHDRSDSQSITSKQSDTSCEVCRFQLAKKATTYLSFFFLQDQNFASIGDFYLTRHSNLSEVHVVYHLVVNDNALRSSNEITSRHPSLFGLRNILKSCCKHDITTLTLPLLLTHDMTEVEILVSFFFNFIFY